MPNTYLFHGPSGSGKDTQLEKLAEKMEFETIGSGDMFRKLYEEGTPEGIEAHKYWSEGKWVPADLTYKLLNLWVEKYDSNKDWVFVSTVRAEEQIPLFDSLLEKHGRKLDNVVHFTLSEQEAVDRLSVRRTCPNCNGTFHPQWKKEKVEGICDFCGTKLVQRADDQPEMIRKRMQEYRRTIDPILEEYERRGILVDIDASPSIDEIHKIVLKKMGLK
jgi:adenylate kinase